MNQSIISIITERYNSLSKGHKAIARFVLETVLSSVTRVTEHALAQTGPMPVLCAGGVMCNTLIRARMEQTFGAHFAPAAYSADNASGSAVLAYLKHERMKGGRV